MINANAMQMQKCQCKMQKWLQWCNEIVWFVVLLY